MVQDRSTRLMTPALCRGARGLLDWTQADLADRAEVSRSTIKDFEAGHHALHRATAAQVQAAFEAAGVAFRVEEGLGVGLFVRGAPSDGDEAD